jgi:hypothetical protein
MRSQEAIHLLKSDLDDICDAACSGSILVTWLVLYSEAGALLFLQTLRDLIIIFLACGPIVL